MAYLRGNFYVWSDGDRVHIWIRRPEDDITAWVKDCDFAAGVAVPMEVFDQITWAHQERRDDNGYGDGPTDEIGRLQSQTQGLLNALAACRAVLETCDWDGPEETLNAARAACGLPER